MASDQIHIGNDLILNAAETYRAFSEDYEQMADQVDEAGRRRDDAFRETWGDYYTLLRNCSYETAADLRAYYRTLGEIVEENTLTESAIEASFAGLQDELLGEHYERTSVQQDGGTAVEDPQAVPDTELLDMGGTYDAALEPDGFQGQKAVNVCMATEEVSGGWVPNGENLDPPYEPGPVDNEIVSRQCTDQEVLDGLENLPPRADILAGIDLFREPFGRSEGAGDSSRRAGNGSTRLLQSHG